MDERIWNKADSICENDRKRKTQMFIKENYTTV
jgi:hypothetical protein